MENEKSLKQISADMEAKQELALKIKLALLRQYADQYGLKFSGWTETAENGVVTEYTINEKFEVLSVEVLQEQQREEE